MQRKSATLAEIVSTTMLALAAGCGAPERPGDPATPTPVTSRIDPADAGTGALADSAAPDAAGAAPPDDDPPVSSIPPPAWSLAEMQTMRAMASSSHAVRGVIVEAGDKRWMSGGTRVSAHFAVIRIVEYLGGDEKEVLPRYRRAFPLFGSPLPVDASKQPSSQSIDHLASLITRKGQERVFFVRLPTDSYRGSVSWGPPPDLRARFGEEVVNLLEERAPEDAEAARSATANLARERAWSIANAERVVARHRFTDRARDAAKGRPVDDAVVDRIAEITAAEITGAVAAALGHRISRSQPTRSAKDGVVHHTFGLHVDGDPTLDSTLTLRHAATSGVLTSLRVSPPIAARIATSGSAPPKEELIEGVTKTYSVRFDGGRIDRDVSFPSKEGASFVEVAFHPADRVSGGVSRRGRSLAFRLTRPSLVLVEFEDGWAAARR